MYLTDITLSFGMFKNGKQKGYAVDQYNAGKRYEGLYDDNERNGQGTFIWASGSS